MMYGDDDFVRGTVWSWVAPILLLLCLSLIGATVGVVYLLFCVI